MSLQEQSICNENIHIKLCPHPNSDPVSLCNSGVVDQYSIGALWYAPAIFVPQAAECSCLLSISNYSDSRSSCPSQCLSNKTALDGSTVRSLLALLWCDSPTERLFVPESIGMFFTVGSAQGSPLSGDECAASPDWHTSLSSLSSSGLFWFITTVDRSQTSFVRPAVFQFDCQCQWHHKDKRVVLLRRKKVPS